MEYTTGFVAKTDINNKTSIKERATRSISKFSLFQRHLLCTQKTNWLCRIINPTPRLGGPLATCTLSQTTASKRMHFVQSTAKRHAKHKCPDPRFPLLHTAHFGFHFNNRAHSESLIEMLETHAFGQSCVASSSYVCCRTVLSSSERLCCTPAS